MPDTGNNQPLALFKPVMEITAIELTDLAGRHGTRTKRLSQAGACVTVWLDKTDPRRLQRLRGMREDFGLAPVARSNRAPARIAFARRTAALLRSISETMGSFRSSRSISNAHPVR